MKTMVISGIVGLLVGAGLGWVAGNNVETLGVGTWDGRQGGESGSSNNLYKQQSGRDRYQKRLYEVHISWVSKTCILDFQKKKRAIIQRAQTIFSDRNEWMNDHGFWDDVKALSFSGSADEKAAWWNVIDEIHRSPDGNSVWKCRAFEDQDTSQKKYWAMEFTASVLYTQSDRFKDTARLENELRKGILYRDQLTDADKANLRSNYGDILAENPDLEKWIFKQ